MSIKSLKINNMKNQRIKNLTHDKILYKKDLGLKIKV